MWADWLLDGVLAAVLPLLSLCLVTRARLQTAVVLFIALGLFSSLAWARLDAIDVALVEAAIGAGLTGALLMSSLAWAEERDARSRARVSWPRVSLALAITGLALGLGYAIAGLPFPSSGLSEDVLAEIDRSGASHPVTAVLLNFRGYDTLLEVAVLLVAAIGVRSVQPGTATADEGMKAHVADLLGTYVDLLVPVSVLIAGYLVWEGSHAPGGAFQAGAVLAGSGVALVLARRVRAPVMSSRLVRAALLFGPALFVSVAGATLVVGGSLLEYPREWAGTMMLGIEIALTISIALVLVMFFPPPGPGRKTSHELTGDAP